MARLIYWSDLHLEFRPFEIPAIPAGIDAILIAGDTHTRNRHLKFGLEVIEATGLPVVMTWGNHEAYGSNYLDQRRKEQDFLQGVREGGIPLHVLHGEAVEIAGTRIIGATLWTDFELYPERSLNSRMLAGNIMNDYRAIRLEEGDYRRLQPRDTIGFHRAEKQAIFDLLDTPFDGPTVVMTHHMPARACIAPHYADDELTPAFCNDLGQEIATRDVAAWIYGHSHENEEFDLEGANGTIRFRSNPRGYPGEQTRFDPLTVIEV